MPRNLNLEPYPNFYIDRTKQKPLTKFRDQEEAMKVELVAVTGVDYFLKEFIHCAHYNKPPDHSDMTNPDEIVEALVAEQSLWQGLEIIQFRFKITGVTRIFTHQLVRARVGITFSQQCSGDMDWRHHDCLLSRVVDSEETYNYILHAKKMYSYLMNTGVSGQEARYMLPQTLETFIYCNMSFATLLQLYAKRSCTMTQTWEMVRFARAMKAAVVARCPFLESLIVCPCETQKCWFQKAKYGLNETFLYQPDANHDNYSWHPDSFINPGTNEQCSSGETPVGTIHFHGDTQIPADEFDALYEKYEAHL